MPRTLVLPASRKAVKKTRAAAAPKRVAKAAVKPSVKAAERRTRKTSPSRSDVSRADARSDRALSKAAPKKGSSTVMPKTPNADPVSVILQTPKLTDPLPIRLTRDQLDRLDAKRRVTGVPVQELIRRAVDHMLATLETSKVPERTA